MISSRCERCGESCGSQAIFRTVGEDTYVFCSDNCSEAHEPIHVPVTLALPSQPKSASPTYALGKCFLSIMVGLMIGGAMQGQPHLVLGPLVAILAFVFGFLYGGYCAIKGSMP